MEGTFKERVLLLLDERGPASIAEISRGLDECKEFVSGYLHALADCDLLMSTEIGRAKVFLRKQYGNGTTIQRFSVNSDKKQTIQKGEHK